MHPWGKELKAGRVEKKEMKMSKAAEGNTRE